MTYGEQHLCLLRSWSEEPWKRCCGRRVYHWSVGNLAPSGPWRAQMSTAIIQSVWARLVGRGIHEASLEATWITSHAIGLVQRSLPQPTSERQTLRPFAAHPAWSAFRPR